MADEDTLDQGTVENTTLDTNEVTTAEEAQAFDPSTYTLNATEIDAYKGYVQEGLSSADIAAKYPELGISAADVETVMTNNQLELPSGQLTGTGGGTLDSSAQQFGGIDTSQMSDEERLEAVQTGLDEIAQGDASFVPGTDIEATSPDTSIQTGDEGVEQIGEIEDAVATQAEAPEDAVAGVVGTTDAPTATTATADSATTTDATVTSAGTAAQAAGPGDVTAATYDAATSGDAASVEAVEGTITADALAELDASQYEASTADAVRVEVPEGATVEAATATMAPEDLATAAEVAGVELGKISRFKSQMRTVGLSDEEIAMFGDDPEAMELALSNYTDEQRGLIAGIPEEAFVSVQMDQLLNGLADGEIPTWARPAVASVEAMLARRGLTASTVGRDALANVIIQASIPLAQSNAQTVKESAFRRQDFERNVMMQEAQFRQQSVLQNAQNTFNLKLANLSNEQQARLANASFMQTVSITDATNAQQAAIQNAINLTNMDTTKLSTAAQLAVRNADAFLSMDMANLSNKQQSAVINAQMIQQKMLSDQAAQNAARQFNAASANQVTTFMANLGAQIAQFNAMQTNAMSQFNAAESNKISAQNAQNATSVAVENARLGTQASISSAQIESDVSIAGAQISSQEKLTQAQLDTQTSLSNSEIGARVAVANAQMMTEVDQFNTQIEAQTEQWNAANAQMVEQSNIEWRRQANLADTAAQNAINQQSAQNAFNMTLQAQNSLWQQLRDEATFAFTAFENDQDRKAQLYATAIGNESAAAESYDQTTHLVNLANSFFNG